MRVLVGTLLLAAMVGLGLGTGQSLATAQTGSNDNNIAMMDTCLPGDPAWNPTGGCDLKPHQGDVSNAEFGALLSSSLSAAVIGHPAWRNEPSHLTANRGRTVRITNRGGRGHTFTEVDRFGGGRVPPLNQGLTPAPECLSPNVVNVAPGGTVDIPASNSGLHKFQCCIHPWMRATIRVE